MKSTFQLTDEQISELIRFEPVLQTPEFIDWYKKELKTSDEFTKLLDDKKFRYNIDLTLDDFYILSHKIVGLFGSTQLRIKGKRSTFESNNLKTFNESLRELYYGEQPISTRFDNFLGNKKVRIVTASAFLMLPNHTEYPYVASFMYDVIDYLGIDSTQNDEALKQAQKEFGISQNFSSEISEEYFKLLVILREIKNSLKLDSYFLIQNLLWDIYSQLDIINPNPTAEGTGEDTSEDDKGLPFGTESTLRDFLAASPNLIEKDMKVIQTEYPTTVGPIDILCTDKNNKFVVIEVKRTKDSDKAVGKILRYMGAIKEEKKEDPRGILIMYEEDSRINYALKVLNNVKLKYYKVNFSLSDAPNN